MSNVFQPAGLIFSPFINITNYVP